MSTAFSAMNSDGSNVVPIASEGGGAPLNEDKWMKKYYLHAFCLNLRLMSEMIVIYALPVFLLKSDLR